MTSNGNAAVAVTGALVGAALVGGAWLLLRTATKKVTKVSLTINTPTPPNKIIATLKDKEAPYALDASSPLLPLPASLGNTYLNKVLDVLRVEDAEYGEAERGSVKLTFKSVGCECELVYRASAKGSSVEVESEITADGPMGTAYLVTGVGLAQVMARLLLLKLKLEMATKEAAAA